MVLLRVLRVIGRVVMVAVWTCAVFLVRLALLLLTFVSAKLELRLRQALFRLWGRGIAHFIGMRVIVKGKPPQAPFLLVSNHVSHIDAYLLGSILGSAFVAKSEVASWPVFGAIAKRCNIIFVDRENYRDALRVNDLILRDLDLGNGVVMFAESTTSRGLDVRPFKTALLEPAARNSYPVHCATIHYQTPRGTPPASQWVCWWNGTPFVKHLIRVLGMPGFTATVTFADTPVTASDRKLLAERLREVCMAQFTPIE